NLSLRTERYTANTADKDDRVPTMVVLSPDEKFLIVGTTFDERPHANPDGSPILWVKKNGSLKVIASNAPDPDGLVVFQIGRDGKLSSQSFQDGGGGSPFYPAFLHKRPDCFLVGTAVGDGVLMASINSEGRVDTGPLVQIDTSAGKPSELCWLAVSPDDKYVYATNFGYSNICSYRIDGNVVSIAKDPACPKVPGDGTFRAL